LRTGKEVEEPRWCKVLLVWVCFLGERRGLAEGELGQELGALFLALVLVRLSSVWGQGQGRVLAQVEGGWLEVLDQESGRARLSSIWYIPERCPDQRVDCTLRDDLV
jgi:hypothetical protein